MFKHKAKPSRIYSFDCRHPSEDETIHRQIFKAHIYRNKLVEEELSRRSKIEQVQLETYPTLDRLKKQAEGIKARYKALQEEIKSQRQKTRSKSENKELRLKAQRTGRHSKIAWARYSEYRKQCWKDPSLVVAMNEITAASKIKRKSLRHEAAADGLYWGNYQTVEAGTKMGGKVRPAFRKYRPDGKVRVQVCYGLAPAKLFLCLDTRVRLFWEITENRPADPWAHGVPPRFRRARFMMRIGSTAKGKPVWTQAGFVMHRPLPSGSLVKEVSLVRRHVGPKETWKIQFTMSQDSWAAKATGHGKIGFDVGWRLLLSHPDPAERGLRIATWEGDDGRKGKIIIPPDLYAYWTKSSDIQEIRDKAFNAVMGQLRVWLGRENNRSTPDWLTEATEGCALWKKKGRLYRLITGGFKFTEGVKEVVLGWRDRRFSGDAAIFRILDDWRRHDLHLYNWQEANRTKAMRRREQFYHDEVAQFRERYCKAGVEKTNWHKMILNPPPEADLKKLAGMCNVIAAVGRFVAIVTESMGVTKVDPAYTTKKCRHCQKKCKFNAIKELRHTCEHCGHEWDQDENACGNILDLLIQSEDEEENQDPDVEEASR